MAISAAAGKKSNMWGSMATKFWAKIKNGDKGYFTIEAILSLSIFMFAFISLVSLAAIAKVESVTQYAINQAAKEISQYYYIAARVGLARTDQGGVAEIDESIQAIFDFTDSTKTVASNYSGGSSASLAGMMDTFENISNDVNTIGTAAQNVYSSLGPILDDPKGIIGSLSTMLLQQAKNELIGRIIAQPLCKALVPKYISSNGNADETLRKMGVVGGMDGLDFRMSSFLTDQRSINIVVIYQVEVMGFGMFDRTITIKQTASTAAWVKEKSLSDAVGSVSPWTKGDFERGAEFAARVKNENGGKAVASGRGIDLYDQASNTFTEIYSMNVFAASYSDYAQTSANPESVDNYSFKESTIKGKVKGYANKLLADIDKIDVDIKMDDGRTVQTAQESVQPRKAVLILVVPDEARKNQNNLDILNRIAKEIEAETGVTVQWTYREAALGKEV